MPPPLNRHTLQPDAAWPQRPLPSRSRWHRGCQPTSRHCQACQEAAQPRPFAGKPPAASQHGEAACRTHASRPGGGRRPGLQSPAHPPQHTHTPRPTPRPLLRLAPSPEIPPTGLPPSPACPRSRRKRRSRRQPRQRSAGYTNGRQAQPLRPGSLQPVGAAPALARLSRPPAPSVLAATATCICHAAVAQAAAAGRRTAPARQAPSPARRSEDAAATPAPRARARDDGRGAAAAHVGTPGAPRAPRASHAVARARAGAQARCRPAGKRPYPSPPHMSSPAFSSRKLAAMVSLRSQARKASSTAWRSKPMASRRPTAACSSSLSCTATAPGGKPARARGHLSAQARAAALGAGAPGTAAAFHLDLHVPERSMTSRAHGGTPPNPA